jgi:hypothetical protein
VATVAARLLHDGRISGRKSAAHAVNPQLMSLSRNSGVAAAVTR